MKWLALIFTGFFVWAWISMEQGNPTAINGVWGAGAVAVVCWAGAWLERN